jgi:hypothetical protein
MAVGLAIVSVTLAVIVTSAVLVLLRGRRRLAAIPSVFRCKIIPSVAHSTDRQWPRRTCHAMWAHDVLVLYAGFIRTHITVLAVHFAEGAVSTASEPVRGLGPAPVVLTMQLDDGTRALLAAERAAGALVAGPFLAALVSSGRSTT